MVEIYTIDCTERAKKGIIMSELMLAGNGMVMPSKYVEINREEMTYIVGGWYMSKSQVQTLAWAICSTPMNIPTMVLGVRMCGSYLATQIGAMFGPVGMIAGAAVAGYLVTNASIIGERLCAAYVKGMGINWGVDWKYVVIPAVSGTLKK
jgi:hypothetical protein